MRTTLLRTADTAGGTSRIANDGRFALDRAASRLLTTVH